MRSMTGFGRGEATNGNLTVVVEIKSVNNRFRDINVRIPREYLVLEPRLVRRCKAAIHRGRLDLFVRRSAVESAHQIIADTRLAEQYFQAMQQVAKRLQRGDEAIPLASVLAQPGVLRSEEVESDPLGEWNMAATALDAALADLVDMRTTEGEALRVDLRRHIDELLSLHTDVEAATEGISQRLYRRLEDRVRRLLHDRVDPNRLAQEAATLADKADVSEELTRVRAHCEQFRSLIEVEGEPVGRKLEFLAQELNREINTIGSKAAEHPVSSSVVAMKSVLERVREQAANVE